MFGMRCAPKNTYLGGRSQPAFQSGPQVTSSRRYAGTQFEAEQLEGIFGTYASLVTAKDRIYVLGREGKCVVVKHGPKIETLANNNLDDKTDASIALAGKELFIRGHNNLYCIAE